MLSVSPRPQGKASRLPRRKRVTLIVACRCEEGIAIHADTQETVPIYRGLDPASGTDVWIDYRKTVQKITPQPMGKYKVVLAGTGNAGLIESFGECLKRRLTGEVGDSMSRFVAVFEDELGEFMQHDVQHCQDSDKSMKFLVSAHSSASRQYDAWVSHNIRLKSVDTFELVGWDEPLYAEIATRFYAPHMTMQQAVLAGIYLLAIAEATSNYVRSPFSIIVITPNGMWPEKPGRISSMADRLRDYEDQVYELFLACADTSITPDQLSEKLNAFAQYASEVHLNQIKSAAEEIIAMGRKQMEHPYLTIPDGARFYSTGKGDTIVSFGNENEPNNE